MHESDMEYADYEQQCDAEAEAEGMAHEGEIIQHVKMDLIKEAESFSAIKYPCSKGVPTIGYGRTFLTDDECKRLHVESFESLGHITEENAEWLLSRDIERCETELTKEIPFFAMIPNDVQIVLMDMCFNMGIKRLMKFKKMFRYIEQGDYSSASIELLDSNYASDVKGRSLRNSIALSTGKFVELEVCKQMWKQLKRRV